MAELPQYSTQHVGGVILLIVLLASTLVGVFSVTNEQREVADTLGLTATYQLVNTGMTDNADNWDNYVENNAVNFWYDEDNGALHKWGGWAYRIVYVIDESMVENEDMENFVLLIDVTSGYLRDNAQDNGADIKFLDNYGEILPHEIENYDNETGHLVAWVRMNILYHDEDTKIGMYFGNSTAENQENPVGTWADNYWSVVYHLNDTPTGGAGDINDSADNEEGTSANMLADDLIEGKISGGLDFDGTNDKISNSEFGDNFVDSGMTLMFWTSLDTPPGTQAYMRMDGAHTGYQINQSTSRTLNFLGKSTGTEPGLNSPVYTDGVWTHYTLTYEPGVEFARYKNAEERATSTANINNLLTLPEQPGDYYISPEGDLDEYRIYSRVLSQNEIITVYRNQNDNSHLTSQALENGAMDVSIYTEVTDNLDKFENGIWYQALTFSGTGISINSATLTAYSAVEHVENIVAVNRAIYIDDGTDNHLVWESDSLTCTSLDCNGDNINEDVSSIVDSVGTYTVFLRVEIKPDNANAGSLAHVGWDDVNLAVVVWDDSFSGEVISDIESAMAMITAVMMIMVIAVVAILTVFVIVKVVKKQTSADLGTRRGP